MSDIVERLKARAAWWDKLHDCVVANRDEARGTEWFGRFNAMAHSVRGRFPVEDEAADEITRLRAEVARLQSEAYEYATTCRAIPDEFALVPPDGGDVKPWEAVSDMANTITRYREALTILSDHWKHGYGGPSRADVIRAVEDTARAALTAQEKTDV